MNTVQTEHDECVTLVEYLNILVSQKKVVCFSHIPQETFTKSWKTKRKNKQEGVHSGVPDYIIVIPSNIFFIEMKRVKGSVTSQAQKDWIEALNTAGVPAFVAKGFDQAKSIIDTELNIDKA